MGSYGTSIAEAIRRMGNSQAQNALNKGEIYSGVSNALGRIPQDIVGFQSQLQENKYRRTVQSHQEQKFKDEEEVKALLARTPAGPARFKVLLEFYQQRDPAKYEELLAGAFQAASQQFSATQGSPGRNPIQAGVEGQLPATADSQVVPLEQQQAPHAPINFPGRFGQEGFSVTPQTQQQVQGQSAIQKFIDAQSKAAGTVAGEAGKERVYAADSTVIKPGQAPMQMPGRQLIPRTDTNTTPTELFQKDPDAYARLQDINAKARAKYRAPTGGGAGVGTGGGKGQDIKDLADAIERGDAPPDFGRLYGNTLALKAELARRGYNASQAEMDWKGVNKHVATLNGAQQERLRQAISFTKDTIPQIESAYAEWKKQAGVSGFKIINKANLATMSQLPGKAGSAALNLQSLMSDFTSELGTVYKGGNSSTDESLKLAAQNLKGDWNEQTFGDALSRISQSLKIRENSMKHSMPAGISPNSPYGMGLEDAPKAGGGGQNRRVGDTGWNDAKESRYQELLRKRGGQ